MNLIYIHVHCMCTSRSHGDTGSSEGHADNEINVNVGKVYFLSL